ncbi:MAG: ATP-dependent helicase HrpB, partial [gamma proteobacterium symbiont of Phacoides pectinatus]
MSDTDALPINTVLPELRSALERPGAVVLAAPPGSGKTTLVPLRLLDKHWLTGWILMLEPRRLAARAAAARMAELLGEAPGGRVGYRVRFD